MIACVRGAEIDVAGFNEDVAAIGQGVARIHDQVHDDLFDLAWIGLDRAAFFGDKCFHLDVLRHQSAQELVEIDDDGVEVEDFRPQNLFAAEGQQLANQSDSAIGSFFDVPDVAVQLRPVQRALQGHLDITLDNGQKIIEIVRDASGEPAHCLDLARLLQLVFEDLAVGDIDDQPFHHGMTITAAHDNSRVAHPNDFTVLAGDAIFSLEGLASLATFFSGMHDGVVFRMNVIDPFPRTRDPFVRGVAQNRFDLRADVEPLATNAEFRDVADGCDLLDEQAIFDFGFVTSALRAYSLRDVAGNADAAATGQGSNGYFQGDGRSVFVVHGDRTEPLAVILQALANIGLHGCHILGIGHLVPPFPDKRSGIRIPHHVCVRRVDVDVAPLGVENGHAIDGRLHSQSVR